MKDKKKTFLICPVRGHDPAELQAVVDKLEQEGWEVHYPPRDTDQDDPTGLRICCDNSLAIFKADAVHIIWDGKSQGCLFDMGMAFAYWFLEMLPEVHVIQVPEPLGSKSFQDMALEWDRIDKLLRGDLCEKKEETG